jgi:acetylornithine/N-succinyldiaminopimelate aminotransferase
MARPTRQLLDVAAQRLYPNYRQPPIVLERGSGCEVWDTEGRRYLDLAAGIAVNTLGHAHPALSRAVTQQAERLIHVSNYFFNEPAILLADKLCGLARMDRAFFCNSGTEAVEAVLKLARRHHFDAGRQQRSRIIAFERSFHGRTMGSLAATGQPGYWEGFGPIGGVTHVPYGDLEAVRRAMGDDVAGIIVEPVQGEGGVVPARPGFLEGLRAAADEAGALLLADEVQTGVGRTGAFLAFHHTRVEPDAVALAKALGGGIPIGAMLCKEPLAAALPPGSHGSTFGGNPLASSAALAVLEVLEREDLSGRAATLGRALGERLGAVAQRHAAHVEEVRGLGLLQGLVLRESVDARDVLGRLRDAGVLLTLAGGRALRFSPPLVVTDAELAEGVDQVDRVLGALR